MLDFEILEVGQLGCNCVILWDPSDKMASVVDPGDEAERISKQVNQLGVTVKSIILTHAHFDHVGAAAALQELWDCPVLLHPSDMPLLARLDDQTSFYRFPTIKKPIVSPFSEELPLGIKPIHTPGHTSGSSSLLAVMESGPVVLSGDTLFAGGIGRTDKWGASYDALVDSIRTKLYTLAPDTMVIPGHGPTTTIAAELSGNPFVRG